MFSLAVFSIFISSPSGLTGLTKQNIYEFLRVNIDNMSNKIFNKDYFNTVILI